MTSCTGFFGKLFGHKFISKIIEYKSPTSSSSISFKGSGDLEEVFESLASKKYKIICKRCGMEVKE